MLKLPIGIQSFSEIIENKKVYVDKTEIIHKLLDDKYYFLSRPRRFGKSLLLSTLKAIFEGKQHLFEGLWIHDKIEWVSYPIIHISFTGISANVIGLEKGINNILESIAKQYDVILEDVSYSEKFNDLLIKLHEKTGLKVVVLIDEYDTPIINFLPDNMPKAISNRDILKNFYDVIKNEDDHIKFFFITGISKFTKISIFSTLNNLNDISFDGKYAALCGLTQAEISDTFSSRISEIAKEMGLSEADFVQKMKVQYNGFCFTPRVDVTLYNPFSMLLFLSKGRFENFWFQTGTPTFLAKMLREDFKYDLESIELPESVLQSYDLERLDYRAILFQTGYISVKKEVENGVFLMGYPNEEVRASMLHFILTEYLETRSGDSELKLYELKKLLEAGDISGVMQSIDQMFSTIPADLFKQHYENFYHAIIFMTFHLLGLKMKAEVQHRFGVIDGVVETDKYVYIFEFKVNKSAQSALKQIKTNEYHLPYLDKGKKVFLVGVKFSAEKRGVDVWKHEIC